MKPTSLYNLTLVVPQTDVDDRAKLNRFFKRLGRGYGIRVKSIIKVDKLDADITTSPTRRRSRAVLEKDDKLG